MTAHYVSEASILEAARDIALRLRAMSEGPFDDVETWIELAQRLGIQVWSFNDPTRSPGWYTPEVYPEEEDLDCIAEPCSRITFNEASHPLIQCCVMVHELAHDRLDKWIVPRLSGAPPADTYSYDNDDSDKVHHAVALQVEYLIMAEFFKD